MRDLVQMAMSLRDDFHEFKENFRRENRRLSERLAEEWIDGQQVMKILTISEKTLYNLRENGDLGYSKLKGKFYYRAGDLEELLKMNYGKRRRKER